MLNDFVQYSEGKQENQEYGRKLCNQKIYVAKRSFILTFLTVQNLIQTPINCQTYIIVEIVLGDLKTYHLNVLHAENFPSISSQIHHAFGCFKSYLGALAIELHSFTIRSRSAADVCEGIFSSAN